MRGAGMSNFFGVGNSSSNHSGLLRIMQLYSIVGAGVFGLIHMFAPGILETILDAPENSLMLGDMFVGAVFLSFALVGILTFKSPEAYAPVASFQGVYKTVWCVAFIITVAAGSIELNLFTSVYFLIMASYSIGDYLVFKLND